MSRNQIIVAVGVIAVVVLAVIVIPPMLQKQNRTPVRPDNGQTNKTPGSAEQKLLTNVPKDPKAFLIWAARAPSTDVNIGALKVLGKLNAPWGEKLLDEAMARDDDGELEDLELAAVAVYVRAARGDSELLPVIRNMLVESEEDWDADPWLARALGAIPGEKSVDVLVTMINKEDPDEDIAQAVILSLATREGQVVADAIKSQLDSDDEDIQATAAAVLLRFGDADARRMVDEYFEDPETSDWDEDILTAALGTKGNEAGVPYLIRMSGHEIWDTRQIAARALGRVGTPEAKKAVLDLAADEDEDVRTTAAAVLLSQFGETTNVDLLVKTVRSAEDRELALEALQALIAAKRAEDRALYEEIMKSDPQKTDELLLKIWAAYALLRQ